MNTDNCNPFCRVRGCCNHFTTIPGPPGPAGTAATIAVGTTTTGEAGTNASVTNSGTLNNAVLNFTIPRGQSGTPATVSVGTTTTLPPGSNATVTNIGTTSNAILNFGIPSGSSNTITSGNFISRNEQTFTSSNSIIELPITLNSQGITINQNSVISINKSGRYLINYGIKSTTAGNTIGIYINGLNIINTNIETTSNDLNPSASIILNLAENDIITLGAINASTSNPLALQVNTINSYLTLISLD